MKNQYGYQEMMPMFVEQANVVSRSNYAAERATAHCASNGGCGACDACMVSANQPKRINVSSGEDAFQ